MGGRVYSSVVVTRIEGIEPANVLERSVTLMLRKLMYQS